MNLVELIKNQFGGEVTSQLGGLLGTSPDQTRNAVNAAVPTLLASLGQLASTPDGARKLSQAVDNADESIADNVSQALSSHGSSLASSGSSLLGSLFGNNMLSGIGNALSRFTGMGTAGIASLLGAITPMILGMFKGKQREMGLDAGGLATLLSSQKQNIANAMPAGLGSLLGSIPGLGALSGIAGQASDAAHNVYDAGRNVVNRGAAAGATAAAGASSVLRWALPALAILALGMLLWWAASNRTPQPVMPTVNAPRIETGEAIQAAAKIPADPLLAARDSVTGFFKSATESITGITDPASAEAALPKLRELNTKFDSVQSQVNTLPADARTQTQSLFATALDKLKPAIDKALAIPGVAERIKPVTDELLRKAYAFVGKPMPL